jgi:polysaccharide biosynthesis/export protein
MRVVRSLIVLTGLAIAVAGCAQRPVVYMPPPVPAPAPTALGVDSVVYGGGQQYAPVAAVPRPVPVAPTAYYPQQPAPMMAPRVAVAPAPQPAYVAAAPARTYVAAAPAPVVMQRPVAVAPAPVVPVAYRPPPPAPVAYVPPPALVRPVAIASAGPVALPGPPPQPLYTLDSGDRLRIVVFGQEGLTNAYLVGASGTIDMPLIGPVMARGATTDELAARIADMLRQGFIREPHIAVEIEAYRPFFILGEVTQPGQYPYVANMTVETAVAIAGGFTPRAFRRGIIINRNLNGRVMRMAVPITFPLRPGDTVNVQERWF